MMPPPANTPQRTPPQPLTPPSLLSSPNDNAGLNISATSIPPSEDIRARGPPNGLEDGAHTPLPTSGQSQAESASSATLADLRRQRLLRDMDRFERIATEQLNALQAAQSDDTQQAQTSDESEHRQRLQRVLGRLSRRHDLSQSYSDRVPTQQTLYDWAPTNDASSYFDPELDAIMTDLRRRHPNTSTDMLETLGLRHLARQRELDNEARSTWQSTQPRSEAQQQRNESLRSTAIMQNARTSIRSPSGTERMLRYLRNRERMGTSVGTGTGQRTGAEADREDADESQPNASRPATQTASNTASGSRYELNRLAWQTQQPSLHPPRSPDSTAAEREREARRDADTRARIDAYRRSYLADNPSIERRSEPPVVSALLVGAVRYLDRLRSCSSYGESLSAAIEEGLVTGTMMNDHTDFIVDLDLCPSPPHTSWLQAGAVFEGSQKTASTTRDSTYSTYRSFGNDRHWGSHEASAPFDATRPWLFHNPAAPTMYPGLGKEAQDRWPVKVHIHAADYDDMLVAGTMEAVLSAAPSLSSILAPTTPHDHSASTASSGGSPPITTYLEGQIIDFRTHSFLTPQSSSSRRQQQRGFSSTNGNSHRNSDTANAINFPPTTVSCDAANWRNLPPFNAMKSDDDVAHTLLSRARMTAILNEWVFMRWKERCFIHAKSDPCHRQQQQHYQHQHQHGGGDPTAPPPTAQQQRSLGEGDDTDTGHGLTISGFYYVSLRRSDGKIEGLYYDTKTSPYQHLELEAKSRGLYGAWSLR